MTNRQIVQTGVVTEDFGSTMTHVNHVDTYQTFQLGETERPGDGGVEYEQVGSLIADALGMDFDGEFDDLPADVTSAWVDRGPWGRWHEDGELWNVTYDHDGWLRELADASVAILQDNVVDPLGIVRAVETTGETWSPQFYNFSTDGYMARWTVDTDALEAWLTDHDIVIGDGRGISGFMRTADDEAWYLANALQEYLAHEIGDRYFDYMLDYLTGNGVEDQYIDVTLTDAGRAWLAEYAARATK